MTAAHSLCPLALHPYGGEISDWGSCVLPAQKQHLTPSSSTGTESGAREQAPPAGRSSDASPTPTQVSLDAAETQPQMSLAASIGHLTEQAKGFSTPDRYKVAAAIWEVDHLALQIHKKIGEGSFGEVLLGTYKGTRVAVKRLHDTVPVVARGFEQEIEIMAGIRHPNVVNFYGACHSPNLSLITEHCARGSLDHLLHKSGMPLDLVRKTEFSIDIARGMNCLHEQRPAIIHRDLKTGNLLVSTRFEIKVSDFGLSRLKYEHEQPSSRPALEGTVEYCSPEVLRGESYSEKCDVWSYGVVLHELLTRTQPYSEVGMSYFLLMLKIGDGTIELPPIPENLATPGLIRLVQRCLSFRPQDRPSFRDVLYFLERELRVARGRSPAVRRSVTSSCLMSPQRKEQCKKQCQHKAAQEQHTPAVRLQPRKDECPHKAAQEQLTPAARLQPRMSPTESAELERDEASRQLEDCQRQLHNTRSELHNSQTELQQLQQALVKEALPFTPPVRAQPPLPLVHELQSSPSADLAVFAEPVVAVKAEKRAIQEHQRQQKQQEEQEQQRQQQQQQEQEAAELEAADAAKVPMQGALHKDVTLHKEATLPCITEESSQAASSSGSNALSSASLADNRLASETCGGPPRLNSLLGLPAPLLHSSSSKLSSKGAVQITPPHPSLGTHSCDAAACASQSEPPANSNGPASATKKPLGRGSHMSTEVGKSGTSSLAGSSPFACASHALGDTGNTKPPPSASPFALASGAAAKTAPEAGATVSVPAGQPSPFAIASHTQPERSTWPSEHDAIAEWL